MSNTILTHQMIAREGAKMLVEEASFISNINTGRNGDILETVNGYKKGGSVYISVPPTPVGFASATFAGGGSAPDMTESKVPIELSAQYHVPMSFSAQEKLLDIAEFKQRILRPTMQNIISYVEADLISRGVLACPNIVGTAGSAVVPSAVGSARSVLNRHLAPNPMRTALVTSAANANLVSQNSTLFHASSELESAFESGAQGRYANFEFYESQALPAIVNGAGAGYLVNGASQTGSSLIVDTGTGALKAGQVFTMGIYATHPVTGATTGTLRQFVVTADYAGGAGTISIYPPIKPTSSSVVGTVNASPADNAPLTLVGSASTSYAQNLCFHKDAFAAAFAPLPVLAGLEGYTATIQNVSVRVMSFADGLTDVENTRVDVLYGFAAVRPDHACRITE